MRVVYQHRGAKSNAGVFIRIPEAPREPWMPVNRGYEVQINDSADENHATGALYSLTKLLARAASPAAGTCSRSRWTDRRRS